MAYTKIKWVNNQTKLSATNLNHMEQGIADADAAALEAQNTAAEAYNLAVEAKDLAEGAADIDLSGKQDKLFSGINIKTINGQSILGEGDIEVAAKSEEGENPETPTVSEEIPYSEVDGVALDSLLERGVYLVSNATDNPANTDASGILHVNKLTNNKIEQEWLSNTNRAIRLLSDETPEVEDEFMVDNVATRPNIDGVVELTSGGTYTLSGTLIGAVKVVGDARKYTTIKLDNVTIKSNIVLSVGDIDNPDIGVSCICNGVDNRLTVEILEGTFNYLICKDQDTAGETSSLGALHSEGDLTIYGSGLLAISNDKGHGIKGADIKLGGYQKIYIDAHHDGIHGKSVIISEGKYYIENANDAISGGSKNNAGLIKVSGGEITVNSCRENAFQAKKSDAGAPGNIWIYGRTVINFTENFVSNQPFNAEANLNPASRVKIFDTVTINNNSAVVMPELLELATYYGERSITGDVEQDLENPNIYYIDAAGTYVLKGDFTGCKLKLRARSIDLQFDGIYYNDDNETDEDPFIDYVPDGKRVEIKIANNTINFIHKAAGSIIRSNKNVGINNVDGAHGDLYLECPNGYGIFAPLGDTRIMNDGARYIENCKVGAYVNYLSLGEDYEKVDEKRDSKKDTYVYIRNCLEDGVRLIGRIGSTGAWIPGKVIAPQTDYGFSIIEKISGVFNQAHSTDVFKVEASSGAVEPEDLEFTRGSAIYYSQSPDVESINAVAFSDLNASFDEGSVSTIAEVLGEEFETGGIVANAWKVYSGDGYSKAQVNANFVAKSDYNETIESYNMIILGYNSVITRLESRIAALEAGTPAPQDTAAELDENGELTLNNVNIDENGELDLGSLASFNDEDGSLNL